MARCLVPRARRRPFVLALLAGGLFALGSDAALAQTADEGQALFQEKCAGCHTIGEGLKVGPDLDGVVQRLGGSDQVKAFILTPDQIRPGTAMPNLGLSDAQAAALVAFFEAASGGAPTETQPAQTAPAGPATGDAHRGKNLFEGNESLDNGGPPCMSCHNVGGIGALGGGALGPDLTPAYQKYNGEAGIVGVLTTVAFPTMQPVYGGAPVTEQEATDLAAFLAAAPLAERPGGSAFGKLFLLSLGGVALLVAIALVVWRRRLPGVRRPLLRRLNPQQK